ncbi:integration host factor subunit alpha [Rickettsiales endosymbiont of Peranema trichophorum]|uniref:HU family DNA-binding protein n=1 Tax=Rickettsiales endosymbiont of Peranema trichophorum TaxID=2486577 RepID=UPI0010235F36|nr:HU family DNA-binding protein [Rickettsiales endosymbiont of Peranema trichophorum]RZI47791.1 integration host factor subunit alpha [Rickettsiales endosymbiont of Peranema trichophorum]
MYFERQEQYGSEGLVITRESLAKTISSQIDSNVNRSYEIVNQIISFMRESLYSGKPVKISLFGVFTVQTKKEMCSVNPKTREMVKVPTRRVLRFKPSMHLKRQINRKVVLFSRPDAPRR